MINAIIIDAKGELYMNKKLVAICEGVLLITIGVLVAIFGGKEVMDIVFGVLFIVGGASLLTLACMTTIKTKVLPLGITFGAIASLFFGICLVAKNLGGASVVPVFYYGMFAAVGLGAALFLKGLHIMIVRKLVFTGLGQMVIGAGITTIAVLFLFGPEGFKDVFWIVLGILIAVGGLYTCVMGFLAKEEAK